MSDERDLDELVEATYDAPEGAVRIAALEEAIRLADQLNEEETAHEMRMELVQECIFHGQQLKAIAVFPLCIAYADKNPDDVDLYDILWSYKWICSNASDFPEISLEKIQELMGDFKRRITDYGSGINSYHYMTMSHGITLRDKDMAQTGYNNMLKSQRDYMSDCKACVQSGLAHYWIFMGNYQEAMKTAKPILDGKMSCAEVPHYTYSYLLIPTYKAGETEKAAEFAAKEYRLISKNPEYLGVIGNFLRYYAYTDIDKGVTLYKKHLPWSFMPYTSPENRYDFAKGAAALFAALKKQGKDSIKTVLTKDFPLYNPDGKYNTEDLFKYHYDIAADIAAKFDKRNGNNAYSEELEDICKPD